MNKHIIKTIAIVLSVLVLSGQASSLTYANPGTASKAQKTAPAIPSISMKGQSSSTTTKTENVYVISGSDGSIEKILVSNWVKNSLSLDSISDYTELENITSVKGDSTFTSGGDKVCLWNAKGNDIYYKGTIKKDLPVNMKITYTLDGKEISPQDLAGKSGKVTIRFNYTNNQYITKAINGKSEKIYVPFVMVSGMALDNEKFSNVQVSSGKVINDGSKSVIIGFALPGMQENLNIDKDTLEIPDYVEVSADVKDFALTTTLTLATNQLFNSLELNDQASIDDIKASITKLSDATNQLVDGSSSLYDGLQKLLDNTAAMTDGINALADGSQSLSNAAQSLSTGAGSLNTNLASLRDGLGTLSSSSSSLNEGARKVFESMLSTASSQLQQNGINVGALTIDNYSLVLTSIINSMGQLPQAQAIAAIKAQLDSYNTFYKGLASYTAGVDQAYAGSTKLSNGAAQLSGGAAQLAAGSKKLSDGIITLKGNTPALIDGITSLRDGSLKLSDGLKEFKANGIQKLLDIYHGDVEGLVERLKATEDASKSYKSFSGISEDMDGSVQFIYRTEAIGK